MTKNEALKILNESLDELDCIEDITSNDDGYSESWQSDNLRAIIKNMREAIKALEELEFKL